MTTDVFLVDDGSTDGTGEAVKEWADILCLPTLSDNLGLVIAEALGRYL